MAIHGRYIGINYKASRNALAGCINDAGDWKSAQSRVLASADSLLEYDATKAGIIRFVRAATKLLKPLDWLILQLSGHGTQVRDTNGDEPDRLDEAFCPYNMDKELLFDDELFGLLSDREPLSRVFLITDCCHSGTLDRAFLDRRRNPRRFIPSSLLPRAKYRRTANITARATAGVVHLAGCADNEVSYDAQFNGRSNGALSYYALQTLATLQPGATFEEWFRLIQAKFTKSRFSDQHPQLNCSADARDWVVPGFELAPSPIVPLEPAGPGVSVIVNGWQATGWRKVS